MRNEANIRIDGDSWMPPAEQVRCQISHLVATRSLCPGDRLPPVRQLARDLALAPGTVAKAYRALEADGIVATDGRRGTTVAPSAQVRHHEILARAARRYLEEAERLGVSFEDALAALRESGVVRSAPATA